MIPRFASNMPEPITLRDSIIAQKCGLGCDYGDCHATTVNGDDVETE